MTAAEKQKGDYTQTQRNPPKLRAVGQVPQGIAQPEPEGTSERQKRAKLLADLLAHLGRTRDGGFGGAIWQSFICAARHGHDVGAAAAFFTCRATITGAAARRATRSV